jgi:hypothetical protein
MKFQIQQSALQGFLKFGLHELSPPREPDEALLPEVRPA